MENVSIPNDFNLHFATAYYPAKSFKLNASLSISYEMGESAEKIAQTYRDDIA